MTDFSVGAVIGGSFRVWRRNFATFTLAALAIDSPAIVLTGLWQSAARDVFASPSRALFAISSVLATVTAGALTAGTLRGLGGERAKIGEMLRVGLSRFWVVLRVSLVGQLAIGLGLILLVVPGLALVAGLWVALPAAVHEGKGMSDAFARSWELTKGQRWKVLAVAIVTLFISMSFLLASSAALQAAVEWGASGPAAAALVEGFESLPVGFIAVVSAVSYRDIRAAREGMAGAQLASVFE